MEYLLLFLAVGAIGIYSYRKMNTSHGTGPANAHTATRPAASPTRATSSWPARDEFACEVVGESHYQDNIARVILVAHNQATETPLYALLTPESNNKHDSNAVSVTIGGAQVGFLPRDFAPIYRQRLRAEGVGMVPVYCQAIITGGHILNDGSQASFGVMLDIESPDEDDDPEEN